MTPPEVLALGRPDGAPPDTPGWRVRVVPNLNPAVDGAEGAHEVAAHGTAHLLRLAELDPDELGLIAEAWALRARAHADAGRPGVVAGVNEGRRAGASLEHSHSQILALPEPPPRLATELALAADGADVLDTSPDGPRAVAVDDGVVLFSPEAPRVGYELRAAPVDVQPDAFAAPTRLAVALRLAVAAFDALHGAIPLNVLLHTRPAGVATPFRWHLEVIPRVGVQALLELGAGVMVCHAAPEGAAEAYREALAGRSAITE
jgi:UDPglucose--hexose-1-phosphate uridylyltransferase